MGSGPFRIFNKGHKIITPFEKLFAKILDHLELEYEYEATTFILETQKNGNIKRAFKPDFFIPEWNCFVELTAAKSQTRKRRKIRDTLEQNPHLNIILLCQNDYDELKNFYNFLG